MKTARQRAIEHHFQRPGHYTEADRRKIPLTNFGDPKNRKYPVMNQSDLRDAARLIGHARDPAAVKARLIRIAHRMKLKLPEAWQ